MTRRTWLQRALASAAFVAGAQFGTLVDRKTELVQLSRKTELVQLSWTWENNRGTVWIADMPDELSMYHIV